MKVVLRWSHALTYLFHIAPHLRCPPAGQLLCWVWGALSQDHWAGGGHSCAGVPPSGLEGEAVIFARGSVHVMYAAGRGPWPTGGRIPLKLGWEWTFRKMNRVELFLLDSTFHTSFIPWSTFSRLNCNVQIYTQQTIPFLCRKHHYLFEPCERSTSVTVAVYTCDAYFLKMGCWNPYRGVVDLFSILAIYVCMK